MSQEGAEIVHARLLTAAFAIAALSAVAVAPSQAATPPCAARALVVWLNTQAGTAAGTTYYKLEFTNLSAHACTLRGYPGVSAIGANGHRVGSPAGRNPAHRARVVTVARGGSAVAVLQIGDAHNFPPASCRLVTVAGLLVYAPGTTRAKTVPFPFPTCAKAGTVTLHIESVQRA
jgi:Protein of unknown function (DUF4232)